MPTYVYRRPDGTTFEIFQRISDTPLTEDPDSGEPVHRVISGGAGLQFKGDGFYLTDYARKDGKSDSAAGPEANSDSKKPESTTETAAATSTGTTSDED